MNLRPEHIGCPEFRRLLRQDRRGFLRSGFLGFAGLSMPNLLRLEAQAKAAGARLAAFQSNHEGALIDRIRQSSIASGIAAPSRVEIASCGHALMSEQPDAVLAALQGKAQPVAAVTRAGGG